MSRYDVEMVEVTEPVVPRRRGGNALGTVITLAFLAFAGWRAWTDSTLRPFRSACESIQLNHPAADVRAAFDAVGYAEQTSGPSAASWHHDWGLLHHADCSVHIDANGDVVSVLFVAGTELSECDEVEGRREHPGLCDGLDVISP